MPVIIIKGNRGRSVYHCGFYYSVRHVNNESGAKYLICRHRTCPGSVKIDVTSGGSVLWLNILQHQCNPDFAYAGVCTLKNLLVQEATNRIDETLAALFQRVTGMFSSEIASQVTLSEMLPLMQRVVRVCKHADS